MKQIISFPHLGDYHYPIKKLLENLTNMEVQEAPPITNKTIELGSKYSPDTVCLPFKYNLGNLIEALDNKATILFQAGGGCRYRYYASVQEEILKDLGYQFKMYKLISKDSLSLKEVYKIFKEINPRLKKSTFIYNLIYTILFIIYMDKIDIIIRKKIGFVKKKKDITIRHKKMLNEMYKSKNILILTKIYYKYKKIFKRIKVSSKNHLKIAIIGELYTSMEKSSNYYLEEELAKFNIEIKRFTNLTYLLIIKKYIHKYMLFKCRKYCKYMLGADGLDNVYRLIYAKEKKYDGVIHIKPFGCTPEIGAINILNKVSKDLDIPIIFFSLDTQIENEAIKTRLEAFYDLLKIRGEKICKKDI